VTARLALTGGIATGKSHVRATFESLGVPTIDSDVLARKAVEPSTPGFDAVVSRFGREVVAADGSLDRRKLGAVVFADEEARRALEGIVHPEVRRATEAWFAQLQDSDVPFAIADIPLLYEVDRDRDFDAVIVAACSPALQLRRVMDRDDLSEEDARRRIAAQLPIDEKRRRADYVIWTDLSFEETERQVRRVHQLLRDRYQRLPPT
jgi:dephospho-CoA kinase